MARTGITQEQVFAAIAALQSRGERVTPTTIRAELGGTGSFGTIGAYLKVYKEAQAAVPEPEPQPVPETVQILFQRAWSAAQATAQADLSSERESLQAEMTALQAELDEITADKDEAIRVLEMQLEQAQEATAGLAGELKEERGQALAQAERLGQLAMKVDVLEKEKKTTDKALAEAAANNKKAEALYRDHVALQGLHEDLQKDYDRLKSGKNP